MFTACIVEGSRCLQHVWLRVVGVYMLWVGHSMYS